VGFPAAYHFIDIQHHVRLLPGGGGGLFFLFVEFVFFLFFFFLLCFAFASRVVQEQPYRITRTLVDGVQVCWTHDGVKTLTAMCTACARVRVSCRYITTDCGAVANTMGPPLNLKTKEEAAAATINGGTDLEMGTDIWNSSLLSAVSQVCMFVECTSEVNKPHHRDMPHTTARHRDTPHTQTRASYIPL
jgi:hypothetical protein